MSSDFFDPARQQQRVVLIDAARRKAVDRIVRACNAEGAEITFDNILDRVTGSDGKSTDYILEAPAKCLNCRREIQASPG
jgi:hypothetical protein